MSGTSLYLVTPAISDAAAFRPLLEAALKASAAACVHLRVAGNGEQEKAILLLGPLVQAAGAALLIDPPSDLREVARWGADGVHCANPDGVQSALEALKPDRITGVGGLRNRDAAMTAGEAGCDYVMFGEPRADGSLPPLEQVVERCQWWVEIFNTPCIGYAPSTESIPALAATGVEFIALGDWAFAGDAKAVGTRLTAIREQV